MKKQQLLFLILIFLFSGTLKSFSANDLHAKSYLISIDTVSYSKKSISAHTTIRLQALKTNTTQLILQLLQLKVDAVKSGSTALTYTYNDTSLVITVPAPLQLNDSIDITVWYHGTPYVDPRFGGFEFNGVYAFNIGVGFISDPHNLGKAWFPCIDTFTDKAHYEFYVTSPAGYKAFCNGLLQDSLVNPDKTVTWHWKIKEILPTYLASVAVAPYHTLRKMSHGLPVEWAVLPGDSANTVKTFAKFDTALSAFVSSYGPYPYEKAGYVLVPFTGGAMEHATSIHIGQYFVNGSLTYETMWAHELSHMWWGDKVTCANAGDMWLNEGWASFNEALFTEWAYGKKAYKNWIRDNHLLVLRLAHRQDKSYLALTGVPHDYTYGTTVYKKGEDVVHTLRMHLGDAAFFKACKDYMNTYANGNADVSQMSSAFQSSSGKDMNTFFNDWISTPGFPHFSIDSTHVIQSGNNFAVTVYTRQRSVGNNHIYKMPVECSFTAMGHDTTIALTIDSTRNQFQLTLPYAPQWIALDKNEKISDAITDYYKIFTKVDSLLYPSTNVKVRVLNIGKDSSTVRVENNWVTPDPVKYPLPGRRISGSRYWKVDGLFGEGFVCRGTFYYDGSAPDITYSPLNGYFDNDVLKDNEDSLCLYYRASPASDWRYAKGQALHQGKTTDMLGYITLDTLLKGEYVLGKGFAPTSKLEKIKTRNRKEFKIIPNPSSGHSFKVIFPENQTGRFCLRNMEGKEMRTAEIKGNYELEIEQAGLATGVYIAELSVNGILLGTERVVIKQ